MIDYKIQPQLLQTESVFYVSAIRNLIIETKKMT